MAGFCDFGVSLRTPNSWHSRWKFLKVSGGRPEYSRFRETAAGDWVRSALPGRACSAIVRPWARLARRPPNVDGSASRGFYFSGQGNGRQWRAFAILTTVSRLPLSRLRAGIAESLHPHPEILPFFWRLALETGCKPAPAFVSSSVFSSAIGRRVSQGIPFVLRGKKLPVFWKGLSVLGTSSETGEARFEASMTPIRANIVGPSC